MQSRAIILSIPVIVALGAVGCSSSSAGTSSAGTSGTDGTGGAICSPGPEHGAPNALWSRDFLAPGVMSSQDPLYPLYDDAGVELVGDLSDTPIDLGIGVATASPPQTISVRLAADGSTQSVTHLAALAGADGSVEALAVDPAGGMVLCTNAGPGRYVSRLDADGGLVWSKSIETDPDSYPPTLAVGPSGEIAMAFGPGCDPGEFDGIAFPPDNAPLPAVILLDGADGHPRWKAPVPMAWGGVCGPPLDTLAVAIDDGGDVVAVIAGSNNCADDDEETYESSTVARFAAADGALLFQLTPPGDNNVLVEGVAIDAASGRTFVVGTAPSATELGDIDVKGGFAFALERTGQLLWQATPELPSFVPGGVSCVLLIAPGGDLVVAGTDLDMMRVLRLAGASGTLLRSDVYCTAPYLAGGVIAPDGDRLVLTGLLGADTNFGAGELPNAFPNAPMVQVGASFAVAFGL